MATLGLRTLGIDLLVRSPYLPDNKRLSQDDIDDAEIELARKHEVILQTILARPVVVHGTTQYEILDGERLWHLAQKAGVHLIQVMVVAMSDADAREFVECTSAAVSGDGNTPIDPISHAKALPPAGTAKRHTYNRNDQAANSHRRGLLKLHPEVQALVKAQAMLKNGVLTPRKIRSLKKLKPAAQLTLARRIVREKLTVRRIEAAIKETIEQKTDPARVLRNPDNARLESCLSEHFGAKTTYQDGTLKIALGTDPEVVAGFLERVGAKLDE